MSLNETQNTLENESCITVKKNTRAHIQSCMGFENEKLLLIIENCFYDLKTRQLLACADDLCTLLKQLQMCNKEGFKEVCEQGVIFFINIFAEEDVATIAVHYVAAAQALLKILEECQNTMPEIPQNLVEIILFDVFATIRYNDDLLNE